MNKKILILSISLLFLAGIASAQELEAGKPTILPDSPFYFLKEWNRQIQSFFTFNSLSKAELKEKFADEKLIELKEMVEQEKNQERIEKAIRNYQNEMESAKKATEKIRERAESNEKVEDFLDKFIQHQALHQEILQKLEEQVPEQAMEKIRETREAHLEKFGEVMMHLESQERIQERLEKNLQETFGNELKSLRNVEILNELEEKVPTEAKEAVRRAQETSLNEFKEKMEELPLQSQERIQDSISNMTQMIEKMEVNPETKEVLIQTKNRIMERVGQEK